MTTPFSIAAVPVNTLENGAGYDLSLLQNDHYEQEILTNTNQEGLGIDPAGVLVAPWSGKNLLTNGGFEMVHRPVTSDATVIDAYPADGWRASFGTWTRDSVTTDNSGWALKCVGQSGAISFVRQAVYDVEQYRGQWVTLYARARGAVGYVTMSGIIGTNITDNTNVVTGAILGSTGGGWVTHSLSLLLRGDATAILVYYTTFTQQPTFWLDNFMLVPGRATVAYMPEQFAHTALKIRRRYYKATVSLRWKATAAGEITTYAIELPEYMNGSAPTATTVLTGTSGVDYSNISGFTVPVIDTEGISRINITAAAAGDAWLYRQPVIIDAGVEI